MSAPRLLVGLASVFAGLTVVLAILGFVYSPVVLAVAVPFGVVTYVLWYHVSGRLGERVRRQARAPGFRETTANRRAGGGFGAGPRGFREGPTGGRRERVGGARGPGGGTDGPSAAEAYEVLGLDPGAGEAAVRSAYRERVKQVHPDTEDGDERRFRRVNEAYERLTSGKP
ncbi:J domain-containing protein [Halococcus hamelinensis]|uniref:Molecular chaperone DnaJ n=2 Tax=Halococcus hamelinensis TaxID=332168 RepID=M0M6T9_9EURY|nr:J domain-containing protein [Halococcus hamelinensis]EMA41507.1 molecular chaperone DnaJ [Halococcus hamelinensis 100A6]